MKELIKKITNLKKDDETFSAGSYDKALYDVLDIIKEQESKPFDSLELGFDVDYYDNEEIRYTKRNKKTSTSINYDKDYQTYFISNYIFNNPAFLYEVKNIKIPNHRFGVELLRNLGVIE